MVPCYRIMLVDCWIKQNFKNPIVLWLWSTNFRAGADPEMTGNRHNLFSQCKNDQCGSKNTHAAVPEKLTINLFWPYRIMLVDCWIKQNFKNPIVLLCHLQFWFCSCVHFQFSVGFVLLILYLCSLPVFSGVCVIDSVPVFASSFQWGLCY